MLGFSVFLGEGLSAEKRCYIQRMKQMGFTRVFTSLHIPEDDPQKVIETLQQLKKLTQKLQVDLMADVSSTGLQRLAIDLNQPKACEQLKNLGITGVRMDYGMNNQTIAAVSRQMNVGLNASTLTKNDVAELNAYQADFSQMELWHNYYPRPETGLSKDYLQSINRTWKDLGFKVVAFVPGDENLRGPLYAGLPTLEKHRHCHPLAAAIDLLNNCSCDAVYIGDNGLSRKVQEQFSSYFEDRNMLLEVKSLAGSYFSLALGKHTNRLDDAQDVIRSQEARKNNCQTIEVENNYSRERGAVTVDNKKYLRYMGEVQITKRDLPADNKVNVIARVVKKDCELIEYIKPGHLFKLKERRDPNSE
ncbi:DUF871 domain-containing protein [Tetragenococcus muriaticus]|uniref:Outer surface protein n=2 Tax=Tetragenococcus muriaticus TaxID=64642 RepID=A0A091BZM9_9ENTE|nr:MupG family TIM beta-alpha barrel fold protein [Tetragenococcus muriaticus]KFN89262.1 outer surface protein [Tetragenococcus muriaticus 3MR10-3]